MVNYPRLKLCNYEDGRPMAAYLYLSDTRAARYFRSKEVFPNYIIDLDAEGALLGIELLDPETVTLENVNRILTGYGEPPVTLADLAPLNVT